VQTSPREWLAATIAATGVEVSALTAEVCHRASELPLTVPTDPCDRLIVATALTLGCPLVTADERIRASRSVETIW
jgi:PIN domain nuclease of toxin-antitoxin system